MKPVAQLIDSNVDGDCFRACVASILELDPHDLPNPHGGAVIPVWDKFLEPYNMRLMQTLNGQAYWDIPWLIWTIKSPTYPKITHAVVVSWDPHREGSEWKVVWDPSPHRDEPGREPFYKEPLGAWFFVVTDPLKQLR